MRARVVEQLRRKGQSAPVVAQIAVGDGGCVERDAHMRRDSRANALRRNIGVGGGLDLDEIGDDELKVGLALGVRYAASDSLDFHESGT